MKQMHILDQMKPEEVAELKAQSVTKMCIRDRDVDQLLDQSIDNAREALMKMSLEQ